LWLFLVYDAADTIMELEENLSILQGDKADLEQTVNLLRFQVSRCTGMQDENKKVRSSRSPCDGTIVTV